MLRRAASRALLHLRRRDRRVFLLDLLPRGSVGAEVGVWRGDFAAELLAIVRPARLHLIDPWAYQPELRRAWYGGAKARSQPDMDAIHEQVLKRFGPEIQAGTVIIHRKPSADAAADVGRLDWVYIDGNHLYEHVREDVRLYGNLLLPGGILCGDDYGSPGWWEGGVQRAVDEAIAEGGYDVLYLGGQFALRMLSGRRPEALGGGLLVSRFVQGDDLEKPHGDQVRLARRHVEELDQRVVEVVRPALAPLVPDGPLRVVHHRLELAAPVRDRRSHLT